MLGKRISYFQKINSYLSYLFLFFFISSCFPIYAGSQQTFVIGEEVTICEGTAYETEAYIFSSHQDGPVIMILAGVHGDEFAGITAAKDFIKDFQPVRGKVIIILEANKAACQNKVRALSPDEDLNRNYPGDTTSEGVAKLAAEILNFMKNYDVDFLLDLHESVDFYQKHPDHYGQTIVLDDKKNELLNQMSICLLKQINQKVILPANYFSILVKPIGGSGTYEAWQQHKVPGITFETCTKIELSKRVNWHYLCIQKTLSFFNIL